MTKHSFDSTFRAGQRVVIQGLQGRPELNGHQGTILDYDAQRARWRVHLSNGSGKLLREEHLACADDNETADKAQNAWNSLSGVTSGDAPDLKVRFRQFVETGQRTLIPSESLPSAKNTTSVSPEISPFRKDSAESSKVEQCMPEPCAGSDKRTHIRRTDEYTIPQDAASKVKQDMENAASRSETTTIEQVNLEKHRHEEKESIHRDQQFCKPGDHEMLNRFQTFLSTGERITIPQASRQPTNGGLPRTMPSENSLGCSAPSVKNRILAGTEVKIQGLKAKPELNGQVGVALQMDEDSLRYEVLLADGQRKKIKGDNLVAHTDPATSSGNGCGYKSKSGCPPATSPTAEASVGPGSTHKSLLPGTLVHVMPTSSPEGTSRPLEGTLSEFDVNRNCWKVLTADGSLQWCSPSELSPVLGVDPNICGHAGVDSDAARWHPGDFVRISRLRARTELNGQEGRLVDYIASEDRWRVRMSDGTGKTLHSNNLERCDAQNRGAINDAEQSCKKDDIHEMTSKDQDLHPQDLTSTAQQRYQALKLERGAHVRIYGLNVRPELNGLEGPVRGFDDASGRWVVEIQSKERRILESNLQVVTPRPGKVAKKATLTGELAKLTSVHDILVLCERNRATLSLADAANALSLMANKKDRGIRRADGRLLDMLMLIRQQLGSEAAPSDITDVLGALHTFDLKSDPLLDALSHSAIKQADLFDPHHLALAAQGFSRFDHQELTLYDSIANQVISKIGSFSGEDIVRLVSAFARVKVRNFEMLDELALRLATLTDGLSIDEIAEVAWAFGALEAFNWELLDQISVQVLRRTRSIQLQHVLLLAPSLANQATVDPRVVRALSETADLLMISPSALSQADVATIADTLPSLHPRILGLVMQRSKKVAHALCSFDDKALEECKLQPLREIVAESLGRIGTCHTLGELGIRTSSKEFVDRALNHISWAASCVEDWEKRTTVKRSFCFAEYKFAGCKPVEGSLVRHCPANQPEDEPASLLPAPGSSMPQISDLDALAMVLCAVFCESAGAGAGWKKGELSGHVWVFTTQPPGAGGLFAVRRLQRLAPNLDLSISVGVHDKIDCHHEQHEVAEPDLGNPLAQMEFARVD